MCGENNHPYPHLNLRLLPKMFQRQQSLPSLLGLSRGLSTLGLQSVGRTDSSHLVLLFSQGLPDMTVLLTYLVSEEIEPGLFGYLPKVV